MDSNTSVVSAKLSCELEVHDSVTSPEYCEYFCGWLQRQTLQHGWKATKEAQGAFWHRNYVLETKFENHYDSRATGESLTYEKLIQSDTMIAQLAQKMSERFFDGKPLTRVWVNVQAFGDEATVHFDFPMQFKGKARTVVWYPVPEWNADWGGDFALFDSNKEIIGSAVVKRDRAVVFDGTSMHAARPMSRYCNALRISVAFGLEDLHA